ncbi:hypothetical protein GCM10027169_35000 [Gordonia jinhuaensis]|uniref:Amidohydrolase-related domain-containing protein n=1 Tax=Gordonia jinhuaensis TaxID=1517702 RepID=A0A916T3D7_9ACTN|nr:hypothetical protein GCM10011489_18130 [Gordonia jinhuaensis]
MRRQARAGDGWVKLVGDWIDRAVGDLTPLWDDDLLVAAVAAAHDEGARVTAHVFGTDALHGLIAAGVDCIEHGTGLTPDLIDAMVERSVALVPTLIQVENFPSIADSADRFPTYAAHMRELYSHAPQVFSDAHEAGVAMFAGTDAGGFIGHGRIVDEVIAMTSIGFTPREALTAASAAPRAWLGAPGLAHGAPADLVVLASDVAEDPAVLRVPTAVVAGGEVL